MITQMSLIIPLDPKRANASATLPFIEHCMNVHEMPHHILFVFIRVKASGARPFVLFRIHVLTDMTPVEGQVDDSDFYYKYR